MISKINDDVLHGDVCRSLALEDYNLNNINTYFEDTRKNKLKSIKLSLLYSNIVGLTSQILNICLLLLGVYFVSINNITLGTLMGISMLAGYIYQPLNDLFKTIIAYQPTAVSYKRFKEFDDMIDRTRKNGTEKFELGNITIENLYFSYGANYVLTGLNATIHEGKITHLRGQNGVGKTTLMRILSRSLQPQVGSITISGTNINIIDFDNYRKNVISLSSEPLLLNISFRENIMVGQSFTNNEVQDIINDCALKNVVENLEKGLDTILGAGNAGLSKGEMQKLSLARVLIRKPQIIILDEPLSHVDEESVEELLATLKDYNTRKGTTS